MTTPIIPRPDDRSTLFFAAMPRHALTLLAQGRIKPRDTDVLHVLIDYKRLGSTRVNPKQETMAKRLACSVDTIQRALRRLAAAGLIVKHYLRDALGRLCGLSYDLAPVFALLPSKAAKARRGEFGAPPPHAENPCRPKPQPCRGNTGDSESVKADNTAQAPAEPPAPVVVEMTQVGIQTQKAAELHKKHGEARCREVLAAARAAKGLQNAAGWVVKALTGRWQVRAGQEAGLKSHAAYKPAWEGVGGGESANASKRILDGANSAFARARRAKRGGTA